MPERAERDARLHYRPDIDGMRAVAVLLVVLNHLRTRFTGGYVGVDVFFVISGYLISAAILNEMSAGRFSIAGFYERRVRRIFPALLVMLAGASLLAFRYFVPAETAAFGRSLLAALFSVSNMLFWSQAGYFAGPSETKPLLHTWSLAVEEQFYIFFPLFLVIVRRWLPRHLKAAIWTVALVTFGLACWWVRRDATAAFFFAPLRAWELLIGTIVSQRYLPALRGALARNLASAAGLLLILVPALAYTATTPFPGLTALPPCLGAALIIAAGETGTSVAGRLLALRPMVWMGLISYSLYLWHWPILVFQNTSSMLLNAPEGSRAAKVTVFIVSLAAGWLSWRFVETPFRKGRLRPGRRALFWGNGLAAAAITGAGVAMIAAHGWPSRFPAEALKVAAYSTYDERGPYREGVCFIGPESHFAQFSPGTCLADQPGKPHFLLLGDSHAAHLYPGLARVFPEINLSQANVAGCRPYQTQPEAYAGSDCSRMVAFLFGDYLLHTRLDAVLLSGRWELGEMDELKRTVRFLRGRGLRVVVLGPVMEYDAPLPNLLATSLQRGTAGELERHRLQQPEATDRAMGKLVRGWDAELGGVRYISAYEDLCARQVEMQARAQPEAAPGCPVFAAPGVPLLFDGNHFTAEGSELFARAMRERHELP